MKPLDGLVPNEHSYATFRQVVLYTPCCHVYAFCCQLYDNQANLPTAYSHRPEDSG